MAWHDRLPRALCSGVVICAVCAKFCAAAVSGRQVFGVGRFLCLQRRVQWRTRGTQRAPAAHLVGTSTRSTLAMIAMATRSCASTARKTAPGLACALGLAGTDLRAARIRSRIRRAGTFSLRRELCLCAVRGVFIETLRLPCPGPHRCLPRRCGQQAGLAHRVRPPRPPMAY